MRQASQPYQAFLMAAAVVAITFAPLPASFAQDAIPPMPQSSELPPAPETNTGDAVILNDKNYRSVMYSAQELRDIQTVIDSIKNDQPLPEEVKNDLQPTPTKVIEKTYTFPQFYLASIAYRNANDWTVWINNNKLIPATKNALPGLEILEVTDTQVVFKKTFNEKERVDFSLPVEDERVKVDATDRSATFMLQSNQTFSSYQWAVFEGKVQPMVIEIEAPTSKSLIPSPDVSAVFSDDNDHGENDPSRPAKSGVGGIMNQYQNIEKMP